MRARPLTVDDERHGTPNAYNNYRCRCEPCKAAQARKMKARYEQNMLDRCSCGALKRKVSAHCQECYERDREAAHGTESRYRGPHNCRCSLCREASRAGRQRRRKRSRERASS